MDHDDAGPDAPMLQNGGTAQAQLVPRSTPEKIPPERAYASSLGLPLPPPEPAEHRTPSCCHPATRNQLVAAAACFLLTAGCGFPIGFSAIMLPQLRSNSSALHADEDMESWIASVHSAATPLGALCSSYLSERVGRRTSLQLTVAPFVAGWLFLAFAQSYGVVLAGRIICGFAVGLTASPCQVYLGELSEPHFRGLLAGLPTLSYSIGILLVYALGSCLDWHVVAGTGPVLPLLSVVALSFMPRSPVWLVRKGRLDTARKALSWFRGSVPASSPQVSREFEELVQRAQADDTQAELSAQGGCCAVFTQPDVYKPFIIANLLTMMQIVSGTFLVIFYGVDIVVESASSAGSTMSGELFSVVLAVVRMVFCAVGCALLLWWERRRMAMVSGLLSGAFAIALGGVCLLKEHRPPTETVPASEFYVVAALLLLYVATNTAGFFLLPVVTIGELLPARVRGIGGGYSFFIFNSVLFVATKLFPFIRDSIGISGVFLIFGVSSLFCTLVVYLILPETKGRTLNEVEDYFAGDNFLWITRHKYTTVRPSGPLAKA